MEIPKNEEEILNKEISFIKLQEGMSVVFLEFPSEFKGFRPFFFEKMALVRGL